MKQHLMHVAIVVDDYDTAIAYYTQVLNFDLIQDIQQTPEKRWVLVSPKGSTETSLLLAKAATPEQKDYIGKQTGGRVFLFLHSDNFWRDYESMKTRGVNFVESPREEVYGTVVVFEDVYGNRWDLLQMTNTNHAV
jgi:catechol 2,3-dioxygenase-like lactoylglutathione lyase family enzyme